MTGKLVGRGAGIGLAGGIGLGASAGLIAWALRLHCPSSLSGFLALVLKIALFTTLSGAVTAPILARLLKWFRTIPGLLWLTKVYKRLNGGQAPKPGPGRGAATAKAISTLAIGIGAALSAVIGGLLAAAALLIAARGSSGWFILGSAAGMAALCAVTGAAVGAAVSRSDLQ